MPGLLPLEIRPEAKFEITRSASPGGLRAPMSSEDRFQAAPCRLMGLLAEK
jgi:hypothetical protein